MHKQLRTSCTPERCASVSSHLPSPKPCFSAERFPQEGNEGKHSRGSVPIRMLFFGKAGQDTVTYRARRSPAATNPTNIQAAKLVSAAKPSPKKKKKKEKARFDLDSLLDTMKQLGWSWLFQSPSSHLKA